MKTKTRMIVIHSSLTVWATEVSNLICSPHFRSSVSIYNQGSAFAFDVPTYMLPFYRYLGHSLPHIIIQENLFLFYCQFDQSHSYKENKNFPPTCFLYLVHKLNTFPLCLTAAAGTEFARDFLSCISDTICIFEENKRKKQRFRQFAFSLIVEISSFILYAKMLDQAFAHCQRFFTAAANADGPCFSPTVAFSP